MFSPFARCSFQVVTLVAWPLLTDTLMLNCLSLPTGQTRFTPETNPPQSRSYVTIGPLRVPTAEKRKASCQLIERLQRIGSSAKTTMPGPAGLTFSSYAPSPGFSTPTPGTLQSS